MRSCQTLAHNSNNNNVAPTNSNNCNNNTEAHSNNRWNTTGEKQTAINKFLI